MWTVDDPVIIRDAPLLRYANLSLPDVDLPFAQLTTLRIGNTGANHTIAILQRSWISLTPMQAMAVSRSISYFPVELRVLRSLTAAHKRILAFLTVPRLERLEIAGDIDADALESLISRSLCDLRAGIPNR
jgi:hypothetical protein